MGGAVAHRIAEAEKLYSDLPDFDRKVIAFAVHMNSHAVQSMDPGNSGLSEADFFMAKAAGLLGERYRPVGEDASSSALSAVDPLTKVTGDDFLARESMENLVRAMAARAKEGAYDDVCDELEFLKTMPQELLGLLKDRAVVASRAG